MILVTGASGFLGSHLLDELSRKGLPLRALYRHQAPAALSPRHHPSIQWEQCDLLDVTALEESMAGVNKVYHCAAVVSFDPKKHQQMIRNNVAMTANVVNAALSAGVEKIVHVSSVAALGRPSRQKGEPEISITEATVWEESKKNSAYARSKYLSELEIWRGIAEGLTAVIINPATILGAGDWRKGSAHLMTLADRAFPWYTGGVNAWVDVQDVVAAMTLLMEDPVVGERFIVSAGNYSYREVFTRMAQALNRRPPHRKAGRWMTEIVWRLEVLKSRLAGKEATITGESARIAQAKSYYDNTKLLQRFPEFTYHRLEDTIAAMAAAYQQ